MCFERILQSGIVVAEYVMTTCFTECIERNQELSQTFTEISLFNERSHGYILRVYDNTILFRC